MTDHDEFDRALSERLRAHEARVPGADAPDLDAIGAGSPARPRSAWAWGTLVAAGGIAAGLILVVIFNGRPSPPTGHESASPGPTSSLPPASSSSPTPSGPARLSFVPLVGLVGGDELLAITATEGGLVGVGHHGDQAAVWTSLDGISWASASDVPVAKPGEFEALRLDHVVVGPAGLVASGSWGYIDINTPRIWYSADGQTWSSVYGPSDASLGAFAVMNALVAGGPGYVTVGFASEDGFTSRPQVWSSADGQAWMALDSAVLTGSLNDVVAGRGRLVAVGGAAEAAVAFASTDGATWTAAPEQEVLQGAEMASVTFGNGTFVATGRQSGTGEGATPAIWRSSNGLQWTLVLRGEPGQSIRQIVTTDAGFVAIGGAFPSAGWSYDPAAPAPPRDTVQLWFSADGETWSGPTTGFLADGGVTLGRATILGGELLVPVTLLNAGPDGPVSEPAIIRGPLPIE